MFKILVPILITKFLQNGSTDFYEIFRVYSIGLRVGGKLLYIIWQIAKQRLSGQLVKITTNKPHTRNILWTTPEDLQFYPLRSLFKY